MPVLILQRGHRIIVANTEDKDFTVMFVGQLN